MLKKFILICLFLIIYFSSQCQNPLFSQFVPIPINSPRWENYNYKEIKPIAQILKKKDVLILSEGGHADGASYDLQCKIIKALVDSGIVNTLYTESSWLNTEKISEVLKKYGKDSIEEATKYINSQELYYWKQNKFWNYLANQIINGKIQLIGIDISTTSEIVMKELFDEAENIISKNQVSFKISTGLKEDFLHSNGWDFDIGYSKILFNQATTFIDTVIAAYQNSNQPYKIRQWNSIKDYLNWRYYRNFDKKGEPLKKKPNDPVKLSYFHNLRDSVMANLFCDNFNSSNRNKSILLIAATHSMINNNLIPNNSFRDTSLKNFAQHLVDKGINFYSVCFTSATGKRGSVQFTKESSSPVKSPKKSSFEEYFQKTPYSVLFIDFSIYNGNAFYMNPLNVQYKKANWHKIFGGTFFIKEMYLMNYD